MLWLFDNFAKLIIFSRFISPSPGPAARPAAASVQRRSRHEPCSHKGRDPGPAASRTPDPLTSVQKERQHHWLKKTNEWVKQICRETLVVIYKVNIQMHTSLNCVFSKCILLAKQKKSAPDFWTVIAEVQTSKKHRVSSSRLNAQTYLCSLLRSRDQPNLGPAVARTPPLLKSCSGRSSSRLNVVDWLLFSLKETTFNVTSWQSNYGLKALLKRSCLWWPGHRQRGVDMFSTRQPELKYKNMHFSTTQIATVKCWRSLSLDAIF